MMRLLRAFAAFFVVMVFGPLALPVTQRVQAYVPTSQPLGRSDFIGMVVRDPYYEWDSNPDTPGANRAFQDSMGVMLARAGVKWVRLEIHIRNTNVDAEIAKNDYFINEVAPRHNLNVLALLSFDIVPGQSLWDLNKDESISSRYGGGVNRYMDTWLTNALRIADRYGSHIAAYEVLNEQNRLPPSGHGIKPTVTGRLVTKYYRFCRGIEVPSNEPAHGCANAKIILGGLHPRGTTDDTDLKKIALTDAQYLETIYKDTSSFAGFKSNSAHPYYPVDGIAYHPYPEEIRLSPNQAQVDRGIDRMRTVLNTYDPLQQFWITEIGYNVGYARQSESQLEPFVRDVYSTLAARKLTNSELPEVANVFWFKYEDFAPAEGSNAQKWGMVRIPFTTDSSRPDGVRYDVNGKPTAIRGTILALRDLAGMPPDPPRAYLPLLGR